MRAIQIGAIALLAGVGTSAAAEPLRIVLTEPEIVGDLEDPAGRAAWPARLEALRARVADGLAAEGIYALADPAEAEDEFARHRSRARVFDCLPCLRGIADASGAERVLTLHVHRMSRLVLSLHAVLRDSRGEIIYARSLSFRGDTDRAWAEAGEYLLREVAAIPSDRR